MEDFLWACLAFLVGLLLLILAFIIAASKGAGGFFHLLSGGLAAPHTDDYIKALKDIIQGLGQQKALDRAYYLELDATTQKRLELFLSFTAEKTKQDLDAKKVQLAMDRENRRSLSPTLSAEASNNGENTPPPSPPTPPYTEPTQYQKEPKHIEWREQEIKKHISISLDEDECGMNFYRIAEEEDHVFIKYISFYDMKNAPELVLKLPHIKKNIYATCCNKCNTINVVVSFQTHHYCVNHSKK